MPGPFDSSETQSQVAREYMAWRKRLRDARARQIEEMERPTAYNVTSKDADGNEVTFSTPFQIGQRKYEGEYPQTRETAFRPGFMEQLESAANDRAELDRIVDEVARFVGPGIYRESAHPEIREGEEYGDYVARIGREYEAATGASAVRRPVPDAHGVRESAAVGTGGERRDALPGASDSERARENLCGDPEPDADRGAADGDGGREGAHGGAAADPADRDSAG
jgi:hypothetical protein